MKANKFGVFLQHISKYMNDRSPELLTGFGIAGMVTTVILAVRATPEAMNRIQKKKQEENHKKLTTIQTIQAAGSCYIPAGITGVVSIGCIIGANSIHGRRHAALTAAYSLSESALREYQAKVTETIGEQKERVIREAIDKDHVDHNPPPDTLPVIEGDGHTLCYDTMFGRYFYSDMEFLKSAANKLNRQMTNMPESYVSLSEFYSEIGLPYVAIGDELGWNVSKGLIDLRFSSQLARGRTPCLVMSYVIPPEYGYSRMY